MKQFQAYKDVSHKTDSNKSYFILQFWLILQFFQIFTIFCNFERHFEQFLVQFFQFLTIQNDKLYFRCNFSPFLQFLQFLIILDVIFQFFNAIFRPFLQFFHFFVQFYGAISVIYSAKNSSPYL